MINNKKVMALIPARGGSKRLPKKNILPLGGKPLISWSIEAAQKSKYIDTVFVSTDNKDIAEVSRSFGVDIPELRPKSLASDTATTESVLFYTLEKFGQDVDIIVILQPTSPLRSVKHIDEALELLINKGGFSVVSVTPCEHSPLWSNTLPDNGNLGNFLRPEALQRSQDLEDFYRINGAFYAFDVNKLMDAGKICYTSESFAYVMDNNVSFDIDNQTDFEMAEFFINRIN
ncbi:cytidylyltransferase domain-containing protein [Aliivibrio fischeri]|uniref:acylneuraminate cytidylyltransferase family protein n=1 Tax=Aliivibrio fischeri TaxID=668 RepID=UPI0012D93407|nr:acylneuraminate cytidylyltransferase family protein [Aliivibrio fischeri]MUI52483.1 acylneuraminate cytidylyltransferase family protein [Aliivibrio fischeri]